ncbi:hypothetical protein ANCDUO_04391 [Ancylostoma duodenale]|uniref:Uncharacterized protein n=1 Tax=Ancylostoma duodenale TaxID=51022 RepID=A0A0C2D6P3_9BILA|nr:hypothetical protein ANCDUO_04391 [Ancylostoma duodenale]
MAKIRKWVVVFGAMLILFSCIHFSLAFITETTYMIGHKKYVEKFEQPWFRVPHEDHEKSL